MARRKIFVWARSTDACEDGQPEGRCKKHANNQPSETTRQCIMGTGMTKTSTYKERWPRRLCRPDLFSFSQLDLALTHSPEVLHHHSKLCRPITYLYR